MACLILLNAESSASGSSLSATKASFVVVYRYQVYSIFWRRDMAAILYRPRSSRFVVGCQIMSLADLPNLLVYTQ